GMFIVRRQAIKARIEHFQGLADPSLNVVATLFSILLGFLVAGSMDDFSDARSEVETEANRLVSIHHLADALPDQYRISIRKKCEDYCDAMIKEEWPMMAQKQTSMRVWIASQGIWGNVLNFAPANDRDVNVHEALITACEELGEARRNRIVAMRSSL